MDKYIKESDLFKRILNVDFKHDYDGCIKFCQSIPAAVVIDKEDAIAIVRVVLSHHFHPYYDEELKSEGFSAWDWELLEINKEICKRIRDEVEE